MAIDLRSNQRGRAVLALGGVLAIALLVHMALHLPVVAITTGDSAEYLALSAQRPPLYGLLLRAWQGLHGSFDDLPLAQFLLLGGALLACAMELARLLRFALLGFALVPLVLMHPVGHDIARWMMSESLFLSCVLGGIGLHLRFVRRGGAAGLVGAALLFGLAAITRSTGLALLPLPLLAALLDRRRPMLGAAKLGAGCGVAMVLVLLAGMAVNARLNQRFEIGSFAGIALLGKALLLLQPDDLAMLPAAAAVTLPEAEQARLRIARQPELAARLRAQLQSTQDLRYASFFPAALAQWPAWAAADWRERSSLGQAMALRLIAAHPAAFAGLWLNDWLALVLYPTYWPAWASTEAPDRLAFPACGRNDNCWALERYDIGVVGWLPLLLVSIAGLLAGSVLLLRCGWPVLRRRATPKAVLGCGLALVIHATLLLSAATEAGFARYAAPVHAMNVVLVLGLLDGALAWPGWRRLWHRAARKRPVVAAVRLAEAA